jgi:hypothetical protein
VNNLSLATEFSRAAETALYQGWIAVVLEAAPEGGDP